MDDTRFKFVDSPAYFSYSNSNITVPVDTWVDKDDAC